ncbi:DUF732 domain-containing protein [Mycolicibacterium fortuitum]|uniref:DUF732 domain-containing protein n=1 Tax=Mycolicibacterium fortuitum TaxID=1766 RepID=UPI0010555CD8|nr:DUF732 domain-containing protein [Mycolicibacterium fortuitum]
MTEDHAAPTELAGVAGADTMSAFAWAEESPVEEYPSRRWPVWVTAGAVAVSLGLVVAAGVLAFRYVGWSATVVSAPLTSAAPVPAAAPAVPPPPPVTVTTVVVQTPAPAPPATNPDQVFISTLLARGWVLPNPPGTLNDAHLTCQFLRQGLSLAEVNRMYAQGSGRGVAEADVFNRLVMDTYPNCP